MIAFLTHPLTAFLIYVALLLLWIRPDRWRPERQSPEHDGVHSIYAGGEDIPPQTIAPGYSAFTQVALFFAVLHLGVLILATGGHTAISALYLCAIVSCLLVMRIRTKGQSR
mgnify:CR=1 FL=1